MLEKRPLRVLALVTAPTLGAGNRTRIEQYASLFRAHGIELRVSAFFDDATYRILYEQGHVLAKIAGTLRGIARRARDLWRLRRFDLVLIYRESAPLGPPLIERIFSRLGLRYVFDFDDAIFLGPIHPVNRRWAWLRDPSRVTETTRRAAAVTVGTEYTASWARRWNPNVTIVRDAVDTERHRPGLVRRPETPKVIGWVGSSTTAPYLHILDEPLARVAEQRKDVLFRVIGGRYEHPALPVEVVPYRLHEEPADISTFHIGVLPEPDDPWTRGKGGFKALLYMAAAIPVVASNVGVNSDVVAHGETGYCVNGPHEWVEAILRLLDDPELRATMGERGRALVEKRFSVTAQGPVFAAALLRAAERLAHRDR